MRILYFSNIPITPEALTGKKGGGWIASMLSEIVNNQHSVAVGYFGFSNSKEQYENIIVYNMCANTGGRFLMRLQKLQKLFSKGYLESERMTWARYEQKMLDVIKDFKPDIIHVFGSERQYGLVATVTEVPVVLHIQGILNPCQNALLPPSLSWRDYISFSGLKKAFGLRMEQRLWDQKTYREREILSRVNYYIGRTIWDERVTRIFQPNARYFWGGEILRSVFYEDCSRVLPEKLTIVSTISSPPYKGLDVILKAANILKNNLHLIFDWKVFGKVNIDIMERFTGIRHEDVGVKLGGMLTSSELRDELLQATVYVHPSYIDNSPNSVCEAQMLGVPCIACNVGGLPSIITDGETGFLVPANDPYQIAWLIKVCFEDKDKNISIGNNAKQIAKNRHNKDAIVGGVLDVYKTIINSVK